MHIFVVVGFASTRISLYLFCVVCHRHMLSFELLDVSVGCDEVVDCQVSFEEIIENVGLGSVVLFLLRGAEG